ncbi:hypothetical protein V2J09_022341 [Rumex salicifolius]
MSKRLHSSPPAVRRRIHSDQKALIPGLPDDVAHLCLTRLPPSLLFSVCSAWRRLLYSPLFPPFLSLYALLSSSAAADSIHFMSFDPVSADWLPVPQPPPPPVRLILRHPSFISRVLSVQSLSVAGKLVLLAATGEGGGDVDGLQPALPLPLVFSPLTESWSHGPALPAPRRWCAAGTLYGSVFVASGIGSRFTDDVARSFDKWNPAGGDAGGRWERLRRLKDGRFSREALGAVGCQGKLWMVNVTTKQGAVYDAAGSGEWEEMPEKMLRGWNGPAAAMSEEEIYVVDESNGALRRWGWEEGEWLEVVVSPILQGAQQIAAAGGRVCAVAEGAGGVVVVDVKEAPAKIWVVETPVGYEAIGVHILPRMRGRRR